MNFKRHRPKSRRAGCSCGRKGLKIEGKPTLREIRQIDVDRTPATKRRRRCAHERRAWILPTGGMWAPGGRTRVLCCETCAKHLDYCLPWRGNKCKCGHHQVEIAA